VARLGVDDTRELMVPGVLRGAEAVMINLTAVDADVDSYVTAYGCSDARPAVSTVNPVARGVRSNWALVPISPRGTICFYSPVPVDLVADIAGFLGESGASFIPLSPIRVADSRDTQSGVNFGSAGAVLPAGGTWVVQVAGRRGVPAGATAASINLTATGSIGDGFVTVWPCDARPTTSALNMTIGSSVANSAQALLSDAGSLCLYSQVATHLIVDINGVWTAG
jgi:hypothetical protein